MAGGGEGRSGTTKEQGRIYVVREQITSDITGYLRNSGCTDCCGDFIPKIALL